MKVKGTKIAGGSIQIAVTFDEKMFRRIARLADDSNVSFAEAIRILAKKALTPSLKWVA